MHSYVVAILKTSRKSILLNEKAHLLARLKNFFFSRCSRSWLWFVFEEDDYLRLAMIFKTVHINMQLVNQEH